MATKPIDKDYLLQSLKDFERVILRSDFIEKFETLPTASSDIVGKIVQYIGADDLINKLTNGFFYQCVEDSTIPGTYKWIEKQVMSSGGGASYTMTKAATPEAGYFATYQLCDITSGTPVPVVGSALINIPRDYLVKSGEVKTVTAADKAAGGIFYNNPDFLEGDKYIDFVVNVKDSGTAPADEHIYINVKDLVDTYTAGNGIDITSNAISVKIGTNKGLEFTGTDNDELSVKVGAATDQLRLYLDIDGLKGSLLIADPTDPDEAIDFDHDW